MKSVTKLLLCVLCILLLPISAFGQTAKLDAPAPAFRLTAADGSQVALEDYKGKIVVLEWINHDCPFVKKHYDSENMQTLQKELVTEDVVWLSINSSSPGKQGHWTPDEALELAKEKKSNASHILLDSSGEVGRKYGAKTTPHMYIIDAEGILRYAGAIDSIPSTKESDIEAATNYVRTNFENIKNGRPADPKATTAYGCSIKYTG